MRAMVLAAGFGIRLAPLTNRRPKCLMPAAGRTLLGLWLERLAGWGVSRAVVNTHHLADQVRARLQQGWPGLEVKESHETEILGTGGGLVAALNALGHDPFLLVNADVISSAHLPPLLEKLKTSGSVAVLGLKNDSRFNTVALDREGRVLGFKGDPGLPPDARWLTYTGLAAIHPRLMQYLPPKGRSSLVPGLRNAIQANETILGVELDGFWDDLGTPERLLLLHRELAQGALPKLAGDINQGPLWLDAEAQIAPDARLQGFVLACAGARVEQGALVKDSLLLPGARVQAGALVENAVLGDGFMASGSIKGGAHA
jgi:mannose-1-phosphate guanylyltransferase